MGDEEIVDLFSGPRGWDVAADALGLDPLGIEVDDAAVATSEAAGFRTLQQDVSALDPQDFAPVWGLIASPPCQAFSMAGGGAGRRALSAYEKAMTTMWERGEMAVDREWLDEQCDDPRGHLVLEPLRWAMALRPTWIVLEQVEPVLPLWAMMAGAPLTGLGYSTWAGVLSSEQYGVPQTRKRAIMLARRDGIEARRPPATHQRYIAPRRRERQEESLFEAPEPSRIVERGEEGLLPWVSMAEALGWVEGVEVEHRRGGERLDERWSADRPADTITTRVDRWQAWTPDDEVGFPRLNDTASNKPAAGDDGKYRERDLRPASEPAFALAEKARSWTRFVSNNRENATVRSVDEPAPTITGGHDHEERRWLRAGTGDHEAARASDEPAPTLRFGARLNTVAWTRDGPATTVNGDPRISEPGHHDAEVSGSQQANAVRVTMEEAAVLQSFPANYPWMGTRTKVFEQIGNAVPPLMALAILREITRDA